MGLQQRGTWGAGMAAALPALALALVLLGGCTGQPSSTSAWQSSSDRVIGTAISSLGTARLIVTQDQHNRLSHSYAVVGSTDAIDATTKELAGYVTEQPPDALHGAQRAVTVALQRTVALLSEVRIELASPALDAAAAHRLIARIDAQTKALDDLQSGVTSSPPTVSPR